MNDRPKKGMGYIYKYTSPSGKSYIGQTVQSLANRAGHNGKNYIGCRYFYSAIKKYGWNNFTVEIIGQFPIEQLNYQERKFIEVYNTLAPNGYNIQSGERNYHTGRKIIYKYGKDGRLLRSYDGIKTAADECGVSIQSLSACLNGRTKTCGGFYWSFQTLERYPIEQAVHESIAIKIEQLDKDTLDVIQTFPSISAAARFLGKNGTSLIRHALRDQKYSAYGYKWRKAQSSTTNGS